MAHRFWAWPHQDFSHLANYLFALGDKLLYRESVYSHEVDELKVLIEGSGPDAAFAKASKKKIGEPMTVIGVEKIRVVDHVPLLAEHLVRVHYFDERGKERAVRMKLSANDDSAATLFEELREYVAPQSPIVEEQASRWTSIRGPLLSLIFGGGYIFLLAFASTADARAWQEKASDFYAINRMGAANDRTLLARLVRRHLDRHFCVAPYIPPEEPTDDQGLAPMKDRAEPLDLELLRWGIGDRSVPAKPKKIERSYRLGSICQSVL